LYKGLPGGRGCIAVAGLACYAVLLWRALDQPSYGAGAAAQALHDLTGRAPTRPVIALDAQPPRPASAAEPERELRSRCSCLEESRFYTIDLLDT
jgi:hypothetical protein